MIFMHVMKQKLTKKKKKLINIIYKKKKEIKLIN